MKNPIVELRDQMFKLMENQQSPGLDPCLVLIANISAERAFASLANHVAEHEADEVLALLARSDRKTRMAIERYLNNSQLEMSEAPEVLQPIHRATNVDQINALEFHALIALFLVLAGKWAPDRNETEGRTYYKVLEDAAAAILAAHFPTLTLPRGDAQTVETASSPAPAIESQDGPRGSLPGQF